MSQAVSGQMVMVMVRGPRGKDNASRHSRQPVMLGLMDPMLALVHRNLPPIESIAPCDRICRPLAVPRTLIRTVTTTAITGAQARAGNNNYPRPITTRTSSLTRVTLSQGGCDLITTHAIKPNI